MILPHIEGRIDFCGVYQNLSSLVKIELLRRVCDGVLQEKSLQLSYSLLQTLVDMTSKRSHLLLDQRSIPSSISISDDWEAIIIDHMLIIQQRSVRRNTMLSLPLSEGKVEIHYPSEIISVVAKEHNNDILYNQRTFNDLSMNCHDIHQKQRHILSPTTTTHLYNLPSEAQLTIRYVLSIISFFLQ